MHFLSIHFFVGVFSHAGIHKTNEVESKKKKRRKQKRKRILTLWKERRKSAVFEASHSKWLFFSLLSFFSFLYKRHWIYFCVYSVFRFFFLLLVTIRFNLRRFTNKCWIPRQTLKRDDINCVKFNLNIPQCTQF